MPLVVPARAPERRKKYFMEPQLENNAPRRGVPPRAKNGAPNEMVTGARFDKSAAFGKLSLSWRSLALTLRICVH
jgi:hypothetical protein